MRPVPLTIQGSSTFSTNILSPNQAEIESLSGQELKIVAIRSDLGLLRLLAGQAEFAVISTTLQHAIDSLRPTVPTCPTTGCNSFRCLRCGSRSRSIRAIRSARPIWT